MPITEKTGKSTTLSTRFLTAKMLECKEIENGPRKAHEKCALLDKTTGESGKGSSAPSGNRRFGRRERGEGNGNLLGKGSLHPNKGQLQGAERLPGDGPESRRRQAAGAENRLTHRLALASFGLRIPAETLANRKSG
jgi:hypothetical protein